MAKKIYTEGVDQTGDVVINPTGGNGTTSTNTGTVNDLNHMLAAARDILQQLQNLLHTAQDDVHTMNQLKDQATHLEQKMAQLE